jgi:hypothetical protein
MRPTGSEREPHGGWKILTSAFSLVIVLAVCGWFLYTFRIALPDIDAAALEATAARVGELFHRWGLLDFFFVAWIWLAAYLFGRMFLDRLGICLASGTERLWMASTLGLSVLSLAILLLASLRILHRGQVYALLTLPLLLGFRGVRRLAGRLVQPHTFRVLQPARSLAHSCLIAYASLVLGAVLLSALGPEIEYDPLSMHLYAAKTMARQHRLAAIPEVPQTFLPKNVTMLFTMGMVLHSQITAKLLNFLFGLLALLGTYSLAKRYFSRSVGLTAVTVMAATPLLIWEMRTAHVDAGFMLFVLLAVYATVQWLQSSQKPWLALAVYATAFSLGTKYQALFALGGLATAVLLDQITKQAGIVPGTLRSLRFFLLSLTGIIPWAIVNLIQTGNPLFPFLNDLFQSPYWTGALTTRVLEQMRDSGIPLSLARPWGFVTNFWQMGIHQVNFHGNIGPFYVLLIPLLLFCRTLHPVIRLLLIVSSVYWLLWLFTGQHSRYFVAVLPGLAIVAAYALANFLEWVTLRAGKTLAGGVAVLLFLLAVLNSPLFEQYGANPRYGTGVVESIPGKYLLAQESVDTYLSRRLLDYPAVQHLNALPGNKKVLFWWNVDPLAFYLDGGFAFPYSYFFEKMGSENPAELVATLQQQGITHVIVGQQYADLLYSSNPEREFVRRHLRKIYERNSINLYEFSAQPLRQEIVAIDFLNHIDQAAIRMPWEPPGKANSDYRSVVRIGEEDRYALLTQPPAEVSFEVLLPDRPWIRFAIGRRWPPCNTEGTFRLWIQGAGAEKVQLFERVTRAQDPIHEIGWFDEEIDLTAYADQTARFTFQTDQQAAGTCDWYLWANPQIISSP